MLDHEVLPLLLVSRVIFVRMCCKSESREICDLTMPVIQFRITFHETKSSAPHKVSSLKWNCSVPDWENYLTHFNCNIIKDCTNGEDERHCPYSGSCGAGAITTTRSCFFLLQFPFTASWEDAGELCVRTGGLLASMPSVAEWKAVLDALQRRLVKRTLLVGLSTASSTLPSIYGKVAMWADRTVAYNVPYSVDIDTGRYLCGATDARSTGKVVIKFDCRWKKLSNRPQALCRTDHKNPTRHPHKMEIPVPVSRNFSLAHIVCDNHVSVAFLPCDVSFEDVICDMAAGSQCRLGQKNPFFLCRNGGQQVSYTFLCDHRQDCWDHSDEDFCIFRLCMGSTSWSCGSSEQCIDSRRWCDGQKDCVKGEDEIGCIMDVISRELRDFRPEPPPAVLQLDPTKNTTSSITMTPLPPSRLHNGTVLCPESHFPCPGDGHCLPVFLRCNNVRDCPDNEDEEDCSTYSCPGFYRCRDSQVCLHVEHVCDGLYHCPKQDDEVYCHVKCPMGCICYGLAFSCSSPFAVNFFLDLRYLDASDSGLTPHLLSTHTLLIHLSLARCGLVELGQLSLPNLHSLDLSDNHLEDVTTSDLNPLLNLRELTVSGNPLTSIITVNTNTTQVVSLLALDCSRTTRSIFGIDLMLKVVPNLTILNLSNNAIERLGGTFRDLHKLNMLDLRGSPLTVFRKDVFSGLSDFRKLYSDNYKLCCQSTLPPDFNLASCFAPFDEISSCESLLRSNIYRALLSVFASFALVGNLSSLGIRMCILKQGSITGFGVFVSHLCISDFVMGVYLAIIGVADRLYKGSYVWEDTSWRHSVACKVAGFLSLLSCQVSAWIICYITLDRFLALRFPLSGVRFIAKSSHLVCGVTWCAGVLLAAVPLLPATRHWQFYSQTGICIPLPVTRKEFPGHSYSFAIMIVLNFFLFLLIATGQLSIYLSITSNRMSLGTESKRKEQDTSIARRLITIAVSDFLCWFPIGLLGLLASQGVSIPGEVSVSMAILVLPLNSALNPFLYNLNLLLERRRRHVEQRLLKTLESQLLSQDKSDVAA